MSTEPTEPISEQEMKEALLRSGYLLEGRLERTLRARDYYVQASAPVPDPKTGVSREMDLYALTGGPIETLANKKRGTFDLLFNVLLIECINNSRPLAFMTAEPQVPFLHHEQIKVAGIPTTVDSDNPDLSDFLQMAEYHHYCKGRIAKQWCSFTLKEKRGQTQKKEWMAFHDDAQYNDISKLSVAVDYFAKKHTDAWAPGIEDFEEPINLEFYYPILVVQGKLVEVRSIGIDIELANVEHIQFHRSIVAGSEEKDYQIDVVTENFFPSYLDIIEKELAESTERIITQEKFIRAAVQRFAKTKSKGDSR